MPETQCGQSVAGRPMEMWKRAAGTRHRRSTAMDNLCTRKACTAALTGYPQHAPRSHSSTGSTASFQTVLMTVTAQHSRVGMALW